ncbi:MAG: response regulator [Pseudomonadales bacterium]|nr:response regulator [Pseudomonadales bacterium]
MPILVVDDAKFSSAIIAKALRSGGFNDVRFTNNPLQALRSLEKRPARIVISDWLIPSMDGIELTQRVRAMEEGSEHRTYVILLTNREELPSIQAALEADVDDFLNKATLRTQLLPRVLVAARIVSRHNDLADDNRALLKRIRDFQTTDLIDSVTGLGNLKFTIERLEELLRQAKARSQVACLLAVGVNNLEAIEKQYGQSAIDELTSGIGARIRQLVRPMDILTHPTDTTFTVIMLQDDINNCTSLSFRRIFDNLYMHSFKTSEGYIPVVIGVSICAADKDSGFPDPEAFLQFAYDGLTRSFDTGMVTAQPFDASAQTRKPDA